MNTTTVIASIVGTIAGFAAAYAAWPLVVGLCSSFLGSLIAMIALQLAYSGGAVLGIAATYGAVALGRSIGRIRYREAQFAR